MAEGKWVSYLPVSTGRQGRSGLVWKHTVLQSPIILTVEAGVAKEFVEVESAL